MDPFAGYRQSRDTLFKSLDQQAVNKRRDALTDMQLKQGEQQFDLGKLRLGEMEKQIGDQNARRDLGASLVGKPVKEQASAWQDMLTQQGDFAGAVDLDSKLTNTDRQERDYYYNLAQTRGKDFMLAAMQRDGQSPEEIADAQQIEIMPDRVVQSDGQGGSIVSVKIPGQAGYKTVHVPSRQASGSSVDPNKPPEKMNRVGPDGNMHSYGWNPTTRQFDEDFGVVKEAANEGIVNPDGSMTVGGLTYSKEKLINFAERYDKTGKMPALGMKAGPLRQAIMYYSGENAINSGKSGAEVAGGWAEARAQGKSLDKLKPTIDFAESFINNIDLQINRVDKIFDEIKQENPRLLNIPIRKWEEKVVGSEARAKIAMYVTEISNETARLSNSNPQSIAEISQSAAEKWNNIHDLDLPISALRGLLQETKHAGQMRYDSYMKTYNKVMKETKTENTPKGGKAETPKEFKMPSREEAPEGAIGFDTETGEWVF